LSALCSAGKFGFVEFATEELAATALQLFDKMELCGRQINLGRPSGYIPPGSAQHAQLQALQQNNPLAMLANANPLAALPPPAPTSTELLVLSNMVGPDLLADDGEYTEICEDIQEECAKNGPVVKMVVPRTGPDAGKAFVLFEQATAAASAYGKLNGRQFDGNTVTATYLPPSDFPNDAD